MGFRWWCYKRCRFPNCASKERLKMEDNVYEPLWHDGCWEGMHDEAVNPRHVTANRRARDSFNNMANSTDAYCNPGAQYSFDPAYRLPLPSSGTLEDCR